VRLGQPSSGPLDLGSVVLQRADDVLGSRGAAGFDEVPIAVGADGIVGPRIGGNHSWHCCT
jgi:hypothetical protein